MKRRMERLAVLIITAKKIIEPCMLHYSYTAHFSFDLTIISLAACLLGCISRSLHILPLRGYRKAPPSMRRQKTGKRDG